MNKFSILQRIRNKINLKNDVYLKISTSAKIVNCVISIKGNNNHLTVGDNTTIRNSIIEIRGDNCSITIGEECIIGHGCYLSAKDECTLSIMDKCALSRNVKVMTSDGHNIYHNDRIINTAKDIVLEQHIWVADNVTILKGVTVGRDSVLGINSTVSKDIPANTVAVGSPAKVTKTNITWRL